MKTGDVVIKPPGKTKMTVRSVKGKKVTCNWFEGSKLHQKTFNKDELKIITIY